MRVAVLGLIMPCAALALGVDPPQAPAPDATPPSAIEQALMEHTCKPARLGTVDSEAYEACLRGRFQSLRADFGVSLKRLTAPERKTLDSICSKFRLDREREDYVQCINDQLVALRERWNKGKPSDAASTETAVPAQAPVETGVPAPASVDALSASLTEQPASSRSWLWWLGGALVLALAGGAGAFVAMKTRRPEKRVCRVCGAVAESGDLCASCRHEAAEALRRTALERAEEQKAQEEQRRRQRAYEEEQRELRAKHEEDARLKQEELARQHALERQAEDQRQREEDERQRRMIDMPGDDLDPLVVLGLPPDASPEAVLAAYQEAKSRYSSDLVTDFGPELQKHFKEKSAAIERAYQALAK